MEWESKFSIFSQIAFVLMKVVREMFETDRTMGVNPLLILK